MKHLFVILILLLGLFAKAQNNEKLDCVMMQKAIDSQNFKESFHLINSEPLTIIDTSRYFNQCVLLDSYEKNVLQSYVLNYRPDGKLNSAKKNEIVLYKLEQNKNIFILYFWQPLSNGTLTFLLKRKGKEIKVKKIGEGVF